jgi:hypothetical protein
MGSNCQNNCTRECIRKCGQKAYVVLRYVCTRGRCTFSDSQTKPIQFQNYYVAYSIMTNCSTVLRWLWYRHQVVMLLSEPSHS